MRSQIQIPMDACPSPGYWVTLSAVDNTANQVPEKLHRILQQLVYAGENLLSAHLSFLEALHS